MDEQEITKMTCTLVGTRPIMFDRYAGDNVTKLEPLDKIYLNEQDECCLPMLNVFSLLAAKNTPSVARHFYGKRGSEVGFGVMSFCNIEAVEDDDVLAARIRDSDGKVYRIDDPRIKIMGHVARLKGGLPNPKVRPMLPKGWTVKLSIELQPNEIITEGTLRKMFEQGGTIGLGTFRPIFGRFRVLWTS